MSLVINRANDKQLPVNVTINTKRNSYDINTIDKILWRSFPYYITKSLDFYSIVNTQ